MKEEAIENIQGIQEIILQDLGPQNAESVRLEEASLPPPRTGCVTERRFDIPARVKSLLELPLNQQPLLHLLFDRLAQTGVLGYKETPKGADSQPQ